MRNKKIVTLFTAALLAGSLGTGAIIASAGTVESKPAGDGLITSKSELNLTNFKIVETEAGDADAYVAGKSNDYVIEYNEGEWQEMLVGSPVPKEIMAKEGAKVTLTFRMIGLQGNNAQLKIVPGAGSLTESHTYGYVLTGSDNGIAVVPSDRTEAKDTDPVSKLIAHHGGDAVFDIPQQWQAYSWSCGTFKNNIAAYGMTDFKIEMTVNDAGWVDVMVAAGYFDEWQRWAPGATITNWAPYDGTKDFYTNVWTRYSDGMILDNVKLEASYTENEETKTDIVFETNMNDSSKVVTAADGQAEAGKFMARGMEYYPIGAGGLTVTNPAEGSGIITRAELQTDKDLAVNLETNAKVLLQDVSAGQKVGFAFGYEANRSLSGSHDYFYFTEKEGKVMFGGERTDGDGKTTPLFAETEVAGAKIGEKAAAIPVTFTGKGADMEIVVGTNEKIKLEDFDPDGYFAILHKGEGDLIYKLEENVTMTGYQFKDNEEGAEAISSNFTGGYISTDKFQISSQIAPENHMIATDKTAHALTGITAENGKIGFYGTSTNSRILTTKMYSDFVMQFDYISVPVQQRGALVLPGNRPSAAYIMFGMKEGGLPLTDSSVYAFGLYEGLAAIEFYGNNETVIAGMGMTETCGFETKGISKNKQVDTPTAASIPHYANGGGYDPSKPDNNVDAWYDYDPDAEGTVYSLYNKTTRIKLVCVNNKVELYFGEVDTATGKVKGEYVRIAAFDAVDTSGYLGIGSDSPAYFEIDNFAVTPVSRESTLEFAASGKPLTADFVVDVTPENMANDPMPTPLAKPVLKTDATAKKVTWNAVEGAESYNVTVKLGTETVLEKNVTTTEIDLSSLTVEGTYKVTVEAVPENTAEKLASRATADYTVTASTPGPDTSESDSSKSDTSDPADTDESGCGSVAGIGAISLLLAGMGAALVLKKSKKD